MSWRKPDTSYWNNKFAAWWHDPIDKVFNIQKHEAWAANYLQIFGLDRPNDEFWKMADAIAAGFERGQVPSYSADENKNGAVDFARMPVITHPTSGKGHLKIILDGKKADSIHSETTEYLKKLIGMEVDSSDYAYRFKDNEERFAQARMLYTHLVLRFMLAENNIGGLGALWHRLPADSRFPDHSIWQHNVLCSAIYSCIEMAGKPKDVGLLVFSITPVQGFITRARKMRDFWTGSVILSWLAFEGLRWIIENLGADHILYPSLIDQPLVNAYLENEWCVSGEFKPALWKNQSSEIASLPNKFLFLVPFGQAQEIADEIKKAINERWSKLAGMTLEYLAEKKDLDKDERNHLQKMFDRQTNDFWEYQWAAARLVDHADKGELARLLDQKAFSRQFAYFNAINPILEKKGYSKENSSRGILYSTSHHLVQSALAAEKFRRIARLNEEPGEKCQMCGEFEVLHGRRWTDEAAADYKKNLDEFWNKFLNDDDFKENERLCAMCFIKRYVPRALKKDKDHVLNSVFGDADSFPSTSEMALRPYFKRRNITDIKKMKDIAQNLHENSEDKVKGEKIKNPDKYYAILMMDGDNMGKLINGETIASTWQKIMHPAIAGRLIENQFDSLYRDVWQKISADADLNKRLVTPAIHAAISEALGDFSIYGVAPIIAKHDGRLIYAGGDDVCAFLPAQNALSAAREITNYYTSAFRLIDPDRKSKAIQDEWKIQIGKLSVNLGSGKDISISASILICHHKESLTQMITSAQELLKNEAKDKAGRNACAVELRKRHGGSRVFTRKWDDDGWNAFDNVLRLAGGERELSRSLLYRLETLRAGIEAIIRSNENVEENLSFFIAKQIERSGAKLSKPPEEVARWVTQIVWDQKSFNPEGLLIAGFLSGEEVEND
jgi:CRISPR-associated protein Cmr2